MSLDPDQIRGHSFRRAVRGYATEEVDALLEQVAQLVADWRSQRESLEAALRSATNERDELARRLDVEARARAADEEKLRQIGEEQQRLVRTFDEASNEREELVATFESLRGERDELLAYLRRMEQELVRFRELESTLTQALVAAEKSGNELRSAAQREAETILGEARVEARRIVQSAGRRRERLLDDARAVRVMLANALEAIDERRLRLEPAPHDAESGDPRDDNPLRAADAEPWSP